VARLKLSGKKAPTRQHERALWEAGHNVVVGVDEVGKGAWAGPLVVGAAIIPKTARIQGVRDSKMLSEHDREHIVDRVASWCDAWAVGEASQLECDTLGMAEAQRIAARRALAQLGSIDAAIVDGTWDFLADVVPYRQMMVKADAACLSVAAASILAKVHRDRIMRDMDQHFPLYHFASNKGYPCARQRAALHAHGPCVEHRKSWVFLDGLSWQGMRTHRHEQATLF
jgi:ribonuclease HII